MTKPKLSVDVWSDVMCPWCAVGWIQFAKAIEALEGELAIEVRFMPFELNPGLPPEGKDQQQHLAEVYGRSPEDLAAMRSQMEATAERAGFPMTWEGEGEEPAAMMEHVRSTQAVALGTRRRGASSTGPAEAGVVQGALPEAP